jgi:chromosome partitioning protein
MRISVVNLKGGVGKTTTAVALACGLARHGKTLLIDTDLQGSALSWSEAADGLPAPVVAMPVKELHRRLEPVAAGYDHVVIDTPPGHTTIVAGALRASQLAVIPVQPTMLDLDRVGATLELIDAARAYGPLAAAALLVRTKALTRSRASARRVLGDVAELRILRAEIPQRESLAAAFGTRLDDGLGPYEAVLDELRGLSRAR